MRIGIDIGNVIIGGGGEDTQFFGDDYLRTPEVTGAFESIDALRLTGHQIHVISKAGKFVENRSVEWLTERGFIGTAGSPILERRLNFVRKRELKAPMAQALELDIFIDDREDIIESLQGIVQYPILFWSWEQANEELEGILGRVTSG